MAQETVERSEHSDFPQILPPEKSSERPRFIFEEEPVKKKEDENLSSFQAFLARKKEREMEQAQQDEHRSDKSSDSGSELPHRESSFNKHCGSSKYKGKKPLLDKSAGFDKPREKYSPVRRTYGYGEIRRPESPNLRDSSFYTSERPKYGKYEESKEYENEEYGYKEIPSSSAHFKSEPKQTPGKGAIDIYNSLRENSEQSKQDNHGVSTYRASCKPTPVRNEDPADVAMEEATHDRSESVIQSQPAPVVPKGCQVKHCERLVKLFKKIVHEKVSKALQTFSQEYLDNLRKESFSFKTNVVYDEMTMRLEKYKFRSKLADDINTAFDSKDIRLNSLNIGCSEKLNQQKLRCLFNDNNSAIEYFIKGFKTADLFPTLSQLQMIIDFHNLNRYKLSICDNSVKKFVLTSTKPMIEKQYFLQWMNEVYGLNLTSITTSSITQPKYMEDQDEVIQIKLVALLCLFYNVTPSEVLKLQLYSVVYLKPHFCFKSHCGNYFLILPGVYSNYLNKIISDTRTCEMKSCSNSVKEDFIRTFCYHGKNRLFATIE